MRSTLASPLAHIAPHRFLLSSQLRQFHVPAPPISVLAPQLAINHSPFICAPVPPIVPCPTHTSSLPAAARSPSPLAHKDRTQPINSCSRVEPHDSTRPSPTSSTRFSHRHARRTDSATRPSPTLVHTQRQRDTPDATTAPTIFHSSHAGMPPPPGPAPARTQPTQTPPSCTPPPRSAGSSACTLRTSFPVPLARGPDPPPLASPTGPRPALP